MFMQVQNTHWVFTPKEKRKKKWLQPKPYLTDYVLLVKML